MLDEFGRDYVLLVGNDATAAETWSHPAVRQVATPMSAPYDQDDAVLVRPDGVVAGRWPADSDQLEAVVDLVAS